MGRNFKTVFVITLLLGAFIVIGGFYMNCNNTSQKAESGKALLDKKPVVYMTEKITPEGLISVYNALGRKLKVKVAVKISTGEPGGENYLSPDLIKNLVRSVNGTIVECNTAYKGKRFNTEDHKKVAEDHGFTAVAPVDIMDEEGSISLPVRL